MTLYHTRFKKVTINKGKQQISAKNSIVTRVFVFGHGGQHLKRHGKQGNIYSDWVGST